MYSSECRIINCSKVVQLAGYISPDVFWDLGSFSNISNRITASSLEGLCPLMKKLLLVHLPALVLESWLLLLSPVPRTLFWVWALLLPAMCPWVQVDPLPNSHRIFSVNTLGQTYTYFHCIYFIIDNILSFKLSIIGELDCTSYLFLFLEFAKWLVLPGS